MSVRSKCCSVRAGPYELRVDENARETFGAFKVGTHDDLVTALGLATQVDTD